MKVKKTDKKKKCKGEQFVELAHPDENGKSRWVAFSEFKDEYDDLRYDNGGSWFRKGSWLDKRYNVERDCNQTSGSKIDRIRLNGYNYDNSTQNIDATILKVIHSLRCVVLGTSQPEADHKDARKDDPRVTDKDEKDQQLSDFQPLSKAANDAKRQFCRECKETGIRYDAAKVMGYPMSFYKGDEHYSKEADGCVGCFWYDPIEFRRHLKFVPDPDSEEEDK